MQAPQSPISERHPRPEIRDDLIDAPPARLARRTCAASFDCCLPSLVSCSLSPLPALRRILFLESWWNMLLAQGQRYDALNMNSAHNSSPVSPSRFPIAFHSRSPGKAGGSPTEEALIAGYSAAKAQPNSSSVASQLFPSSSKRQVPKASRLMSLARIGPSSGCR